MRFAVACFTTVLLACTAARDTSESATEHLSATCGGDTLLAAAMPAGKTPCDLGRPKDAYDAIYPASLAHDAFRTGIYERLTQSPPAIPTTGKKIASDLVGAHPASRALRSAAELWDAPIGGDAPTGGGANTTFEAALAALGAEPADASALPAALKDDLRPVLGALRVAVDLRNQALPAGADLERWFRAPLGMFIQMRDVVPAAQKIDLQRASDRAFLVSGVRYDLLARAAFVIADAVETFRDRSRTYPGTYAFRHPTPLGRIVIGGTGNDTYREPGELLLLVDTGGDDRYEIPTGATQSPSNPVSIAIDLGGKDTYTYEKTVQGVNERPDPDAAGRRSSVPRHSLSEIGRQGSGRLGVGMQFDFGEEDDVYESLRLSQGSGVLGVGLLYDEGGNDRYDAESVVQGAAHFGVGLLVDGGGNDHYHAYSVVQGGAYVKGVGMLVDHGGDDVYWASPGNTYIADEHRIAGHDYFYDYGIAQGAAWGRRGDYPIDGIRGDGHASGGVGALFDLGGKDRYTCGAFCQGTGYWFGTGILWDDGKANDETYARVFAAGSGVHFGLGVFHDDGGDDRYNIGAKPEGLTLGAGDDLSLAWFEDLGGNDRYEGGRYSFGSGTERGVGVFIDASGNDEYTSSREGGFGSFDGPAEWDRPSHARYKLLGAGVFLDGGGTDRYQRPVTPAGQTCAGCAWSTSSTAPNVFASGVDLR